MKNVVSPATLENLRRLDTCSVANAIESFQVRLRNEGFANAAIRGVYPGLTAMVGYAVPVKIRCSSPPVDAPHYLERTDWWNYILTIPAPRVVVVQDVDEKSGLGSLLGEVHAHILMALGCVGAVTNGAVRDVPAVQATGFHFLAAGIAVSHAYAHIVEIGGEVEIGGLRIAAGDLLHGDLHGLVSIPAEIAAEIPQRAAKILERERRLIALCRSGEFSVNELRAVVESTS